MNFNRRDFLKACGVAGITGLSGCSAPSQGIFGSSPPPEPSSEDIVSDLTIRKAPTRQDNSYFIAFSEDILSGADVDISENQQIRIQLQTDIDRQQLDQYLFTVNLNPSYSNEDDEKTVWVSQAGMDRMNKINDGTMVELKAYSASPTFNTRSEGAENNELIEQTIDASDDTLFIAPHGGEIYMNTELQALRGSSESEFSSWSLMGYGKGPQHVMNQWYNPPEFYSVDSFYQLALLDPPFEQVISFTGYETRNANKKKIILGGLASDDIKENIRDRLIEVFHAPEPEETEEEDSDDSPERNPIDKSVEISISYSGDQSGSDPTHIANQLSEENTDSVIISQSAAIRDQYWKEVADAVIYALNNPT